MNQYIITYDEKYRANPQNRYHKEYKRAVNRWFSLVLFVLMFSVIKMEFGGRGLLLAVVGIPIATLVIGLALYILVNFVEVLYDIYKWLCGH